MSAFDLRPNAAWATWTAVAVLASTTTLAFAEAPAPGARAADDSEASDAAPPQGPALTWHDGPTDFRLGTHGILSIPEGYGVLGAEDTQTILASMGNRPSGNELAMVKKADEDWFALFEFDDIGYVKDAEKEEIDQSALLQNIKSGTEADNERRQEAGFQPIHIMGWAVEPNYNPDTQNLEWAIQYASGDVDAGVYGINYNTRILGRRGVMEVVMLADLATYKEGLPAFRSVISGYQFAEGERYAEYRVGDKVAKYGLAALIAGGAGAAAAKLGLFASLGKLLKAGGKALILGVLAVAAFVRRLFFGQRIRRSDPTEV